MEAGAAGADTQCQESSERESIQQRMPPWPIVEGGRRSITNRIHLSAWLIFPIKTAQQEPQQSTSWNRGYFSACLSAGCVCVFERARVGVCHFASILVCECEVWGSIKIFHRSGFNSLILISSSPVMHKQKSPRLSAVCVSPCCAPL